MRFGQGFPIDLDLMIAMSIPLNLLLLSALVRLAAARPRVAASILAIVALHTWAIAAALLLPPSPPRWPPGADGQPPSAPWLFVNGNHGDVCLGPRDQIVVETRPEPSTEALPFAVIAYFGEPPGGLPGTLPDGVRIALPMSPARDMMLLANNLYPRTGHEVSRSSPGWWCSSWINFPPDRTIAFQAVFGTADGGRCVSNVVVVHRP